MREGVAMRRVAALGTGIMGAPMARNLAGAGFEVAVWNRSAEKAARLSDVAQVASSAAEAVADAEGVITMLTSGPAVEEVLLGGALPEAAPGALFVDMSSIEPDRARRIAAALADRGARAMDAPVSGGEKGAIAGTLAIMAGGESADFEAAAPLFAPLGRATLVGGHGAGQTAKLANQIIVGVSIGAVAEALMLAERGGCDPAAVREAMLGGFAGGPILETHGARMVKGDYAPGGTSAIQLKDLENALAAAGAAGVSLPLTERTRAAYAALAGDLGLGDRDQAAYRLWLDAINRASSPSSGA